VRKICWKIDKVQKHEVIGAIIEKCSKRSYVLARILTFAPNQNLIIRFKNLSFINFFTTAPK